MTTTIPRNHTRKIAAIKASIVRVTSHTEGNYFAGEEVAANYAWEALDTYDFARLTQDSDGKYTIRVHGNRWYTLTTEAFEAKRAEVAKTSLPATASNAEWTAQAAQEFVAEGETDKARALVDAMTPATRDAVLADKELAAALTAPEKAPAVSIASIRMSDCDGAEIMRQINAGDRWFRARYDVREAMGMEDGLIFDFGPRRGNKIRKVIIKLNAMDTYTIEIGVYDRKSMEYAPVVDVDQGYGVDAAMLAEALDRALAKFLND